MIIKSILDTDLYKFTTSYAYMKLFPQARGTFEFIDRDNTEYPEDFIVTNILLKASFILM
jgi:nicotinate phosphoribosyltransferase